VRVGLLGTFVRDTIWTVEDVRRGRPFTAWGGIAYALAAAAAARPRGWQLVPVAKVGADLAESARAFAGSLPGTRVESMRVVAGRNNRVELRYTDGSHRGERLTGGVPAWEPGELGTALAGLDALYVNFVSGFELRLETAEWLRAAFGGPIYADLHSLFLGCPGAGVRPLRSLPEWERWVACFDAVQVNEQELGMLLDPSAGEPGEGAARVAGRGPGLVLVTRGPDGASYARRSGLPDHPLAWRAAECGGRVEGATVPTRGVAGGDPTGAGDVWGATLFCGLLGGGGVEPSIRRAHAAAGRKLLHRGASGLHAHLLSRSPTLTSRRRSAPDTGGVGGAPDPAAP
jgi:sugar/nucleoside kinase (ribokinase family)